LAFATFLVWRLRIGACGFWALMTATRYSLSRSISQQKVELKKETATQKIDSVPSRERFACYPGSQAGALP